MTARQLRALIAYLSHGQFDLDMAIADIGITLARGTVVSELAAWGWEWNDDEQTLTYVF